MLVDTTRKIVDFSRLPSNQDWEAFAEHATEKMHYRIDT